MQNNNLKRSEKTKIQQQRPITLQRRVLEINTNWVRRDYNPSSFRKARDRLVTLSRVIDLSGKQKPWKLDQMSSCLVRRCPRSNSCLGVWSLISFIDWKVDPVAPFWQLRDGATFASSGGCLKATVSISHVCSFGFPVVFLIRFFFLLNMPITSMHVLDWDRFKNKFVVAVVVAVKPFRFLFVRFLAEIA